MKSLALQLKTKQAKFSPLAFGKKKKVNKMSYHNMYRD